MDVNFQNQKMKGEYILKGQFLMTKNENSVQQQHDLARVGEGGADRETQKECIRIWEHTKMLAFSDEDTNIDNLKKSIRINKYKHNSWVKGIYHGNKNRMYNFQNHRKKNKKKQKGSSLNFKI